MIQIKNKKDCCGCSACVQRCPKHCISLKEDAEGFLYPQVDESTCIDCGLCEKVCPILHQHESNKPLFVYAAKNRDGKIRMSSSSGGVFTALAETVISEGGVVFGACFDDKWEVMHTYADTLEGLSKLRGSKYVQSRMEFCYQQAETFLKAGRKVLFSGTPCQISGLKLYLRKGYENLLTVDIVCHGVPSPGVWRKYLKEQVALLREKNTVLLRPIHGRDALVEGISFRDKSLGWKKYSFALVLSTTNGSGEKFSFCSRIPFTENTFMRGFLANLYLRPSCYACPAKCGKSGSDITIGDFWGIEHVKPEFDDDKGMSCVLVNTDQGYKMVAWIDKVERLTVDYGDVYRYNPALEESVKMTKKRERFYVAFAESRRLTKIVYKLTRKPLILRCKILIYRLLVKIGIKQRKFICK